MNDDTVFFDVVVYRTETHLRMLGSIGCGRNHRPDSSIPRHNAGISGKMYCLACVGRRVPGIMKHTAQAERILRIDGCPHDCAKHTLRRRFYKF